MGKIPHANNTTSKKRRIFVRNVFVVIALILVLGGAAVSCRKQDDTNSTPSGSGAEVSETTDSTQGQETTPVQGAEGETTSTTKTTIDTSIYNDGGKSELIFVNAYAAVGQELIVVLKNVENTDDFSYSWRVGSKLVSKESTYTPTEADLEKFINVTAKSGTESYTAKIYFSELPVVYIDTENKQEVTDTETYINATCHIQGNSLYSAMTGGDAYTWNTTGLYDGDISIKGRGNASWTLGEREGKKPYKIKLDTKTDLFGMGESKHWVLLADWNDRTVSRNIITNEFSKALGMDFSMELTNVVLIFNGEYQGLYEMGEQVRIEETRVDIFDWEELAEDAAKKIAKKNDLDDEAKSGLEEALIQNLSWISSGSFTYKGVTYTLSEYVEIPEINGGYLLEVDMYYDTVSKFMTDGKTNDEYDAQPVMFKSPEYAYTNSEMFSYIKECINNFEQAVRSDTHYYEVDGVSTHYSSIVDMESLVQYWLVNEFSNNFDSMKNSLFIYQDIGGMFEFGPAWDYDLAFGNKEPNAAPYNKWQTLAYEKNHQAYQWYKYLISDPYFIVQAYELYHEKAAPYIESILAGGGQLDYLEEYAVKAGVANVKKWYAGKYDYDKEVDTLREYIENRKTWFDKQFATVNSLISSLRSYTKFSRLTVQKTEAKSGRATANFEITADDTKIKKVLVLVNGIDAGTFEVSDSKVTLSTDSTYMRPEGKLNVIEVFGLDANGKTIMYGGQAMKNYLVFE